MIFHMSDMLNEIAFWPFNSSLQVSDLASAF